MKKLLLGSVALSALVFGGPAGAADYAPAAKAPPPPPPFNWTGFYAGIHVGGGWGTKHWHGTGAAAGLDLGFHHARGPLAGFQAGVNWQWVRWVAGLEGQVSWANLHGEHADPSFVNIVGAAPCLAAVQGCPVISHTQVTALGTAAIRLGYAFDRTLPYVKVGGAWAHDKYWREAPVGPGIFARASDDRYGWMFGLGIEHAFYDNWSVKIEYNHMDLGRERAVLTCSSVVVCPLADRDVTQVIDVVKLGLNYRFGYGPVYARY